MALKPKDVRVPLPVQLILDCHWLVCVRGEGLNDMSIEFAGNSFWMSEENFPRNPPEQRGDVGDV